jgi:hypothetical protein
MRYLILTYVTRPNGKIDEQMQLARNIKRRDLQTGNVILDFRELKVVKSSMSGQQVPKDFDRIVAYYYQHYANTIDRLLKENGYELVKNEPQPQEPQVQSPEASPS